MDVPPLMPAPTGGGHEVLATDAYEQFWNCWESDIPAGENSPPAADADDAYGQFWQQADL